MLFEMGLREPTELGFKLVVFGGAAQALGAPATAAYSQDGSEAH